MPGLYRNKRKRPTINSSYQNEDSVWHSTPVDSTQGTTGTDGDQGEEDDEETTMLSPLKRPAVGQGVARPSTSGNDDVTPSPGPGPSSHDIIRTPAAAAHMELDSDNEEEANLFEAMVPNPSSNDKAKKQTAAKKTVTTVSSDEEDEEESGPSKATGAASNALVHVPDYMVPNDSVHMSSRYGPVVINPPSGEDAMSFRHLMENWMKANLNENSRIEDKGTKFLNALKKYFAVRDNIVHACTTSLHDREIIQPSLLACLLGVDALQPDLLQVVLPALTEATYSTRQEDVDFVHTIITQMKWLPIIVDGKNLAKNIQDIIDVASIPAKKNIIRHLPELFPPEFHPLMVPKLMELFDLGTQINVTMLDCFSSFVVPDGDCLRIRRAAVDQMATAPLEDLPAYLSFLLRVGDTKDQMRDAIKEMREKLDIKPKYRIPKEDIYQVEILERIRFFVSVNPLLTKMWLPQVKEDLSMDLDLRTIDLIMLLVFVESGNKVAGSILTTLFCRTALVNTLFDNMTRDNNPMLHELFPTLARFIDSVLRERNSKCHESAGDITKKLFVGLGPILSQHLTTNLIGILVNGHPICRDVVLKIFTSIAETDATKLLYFHSYLMGALVYVIKYPPRQMQALMNILAILAYMPENHHGDENAFTAEFMILLRKQITHGHLRSRCFGVLGIIAAVRQLALNPNPQSESKIDGLLALAWSSIENDEEACSIFFDEIISCVKILPKKVCTLLRNIMKNQFQCLWTMDQKAKNRLMEKRIGQADLKLEPVFDANKEVVEAEQFVLVMEPQALQMSPLVIPSSLRVMAELEKVSENGDLEGIDALLGCPLFFPSLSAYYHKNDLSILNYNQRFHLGQYLVIAINYLRECVSAFVESDNKELRVKVWMRLSTIIQLQRYLVKHYQTFPNLAEAYGAEKNMGDSSSSAPGFSGAIMAKKPAIPKKKAAKKPKAAPKKKNKKGKKDDDDEESFEAAGSEDEGRAISKDDLALEDQIQPKYISSNIRYFDPKVISLIKYPFKPEAGTIDCTRVLLDLSNATQETETMKRIEQLNPDTLCLLLTEMKRQVLEKKCNFKLHSIDGLFVALCSHIDTISYTYSSQIDNNTPPLHRQNIDACLRLLISVMDLYLQGISKEKTEKRKELLEEIMLIMAERFRSESQIFEVDQPPTQLDILSNVAKYLASLESSIGLDEPLAAQYHIKMMKTLHDLLPRQEQIKREIETTVTHYLKRDWKVPSAVITELLSTWFAVTPHPIKVVAHLLDRLVVSADNGQNDSDDEESGACKIPNTTTFKACNKLNFHTWYAAIFAGLAQFVFKWGRRRGDFRDSIKIWMEANTLLKTLVFVSAQLQKTNILMPLLKYGKIYIEAFISGGVSLMPELWRRNVDQGQTFAKTLQLSTRKIQYICEHSKVKKDNLLLRNVPGMKKTLEELLFKIRLAVGSSGFGTAFSIGDLKLRDLEGNEIGHMPFNEDYDSEDDDDESETGENQDNAEEMDVDDDIDSD